jgi:hypothetical protein
VPRGELSGVATTNLLAPLDSERGVGDSNAMPNTTINNSRIMTEHDSMGEQISARVPFDGVNEMMELWKEWLQENWQHPENADDYLFTF